MKTIGRVLIILLVIALLSGVTYAIVVTSSDTTQTNGDFSLDGREGRAGQEFGHGQGPGSGNRLHRGGGEGRGEGKNMPAFSLEWLGVLVQVTVVVALVSLLDRRRKKRTLRKNANPNAGKEEQAGA